MHHYPFHPGDHMLDTVHLTLEEDATYRRALDLYYVSEEPLPDDKRMLSKRLRVKEKTLSGVLGEFFILREDGWHHTRCDAEIASYQAKAAKARQVGVLGGRPPKMQTQPVRSSDETPAKPVRLSDENRSVAEQNPNQEPEPEPKTNLSPSIPQGGGEEEVEDLDVKNPTLKSTTDPTLSTSPWTPSPEQLQASGWFDRLPTTPWSRKELRAWQAISFEPDDMVILEWFYRRSGCKYLRRDLQTLLNNWRGEVERARKFADEEDQR